MWHEWGGRKMHCGVLVRNSQGEGNSEGLDLDGRIILK
jgi:hypothetical protein